MIGRRRRESARLRRVVDNLPYDTRLAMLEGLQRYDRIIVGAYTDRKGGVCPMLAAHRCGGRTDFPTFARAWDGFTGARGRAQRARDRDVGILMAQIDASIMAEDEARTKLAAAMFDERAPAARSDARPPKRHRFSGAWLRPFRRWDGYREAVEAAERQMERETPEVRDQMSETAGSSSH